MAVSRISSVNIMNKGKDRHHDEVATQEPAAPGATTKPGWNRRLLWFLLLLLAGSTVASFVVFRYVVARVPRELVGTWQVTDGAEKGATLEFRWYGTGIAAKVKNGKKQVRESSVRVRGKRIFMTYEGQMDGQEETDILTMLKLTDDELVIRDQDDVTYNLIRIGD
jgi:uncharacterized protein (TIGR03066 family)